MRKCLLIMMVCFIFSITVVASEVHSGRIYDEAGLFTEEQESSLSEMAGQFIDQYNMGIGILTAGETGGQSSRVYADLFYTENNIGVGTDDTGILLLINMEEREVLILTDGKMKSIIPDSKIEMFIDEIYDYLPEGDYYGACRQFIESTSAWVDSTLANTVILDADASVKAYDYAGVLSQEELSRLSQKAVAISNSFRTDVAVVIIDDARGKTTMDYADDFYDYNGFGVGSDFSGILCLINLEADDFFITTTGGMIDVFNDAVLQLMVKRVLEPYEQDLIFETCETFLDSTEEMLGRQQNGEIHLSYRERYTMQERFLFSLGAGFFISLVVSLLMRATHNKNLKKILVRTNYMSGDGLVLTEKTDQFVHTHTSRVALPKEKPPSSGSSGGSRSTTRTSSSGRTHGGGGGSRSGGSSRGGGSRKF